MSVPSDSTLQNIEEKDEAGGGSKIASMSERCFHEYRSGGRCRGRVEHQYRVVLILLLLNAALACAGEDPLPFMQLRLKSSLLPFLRLRGGAKPTTPVTPGRASRRLMNKSPEILNASPSMLSGRQKKTMSRTQGTPDKGNPVAAMNFPKDEGTSKVAGSPRIVKSPRTVEIRRSTFDKIMESLKKNKRAAIKAGHGRRMAVVLNNHGTPVTLDGRTLISGEDIRDDSSISDEPDSEPPAEKRAKPNKPIKFEPRVRADARPVGPVAGPDLPPAPMPTGMHARSIRP